MKLENKIEKKVSQIDKKTDKQKMRTIDKLKSICKTYQDSLEMQVSNFPTGTCYLSAFCLNEYFKKIGVVSKLVIGELAIINSKDRYVIYGKLLNLKKSLNVGDYHAWCEVEIEGKWFIIDPSIKYNIVFLKKQYNFKISSKVEESIVTYEKIQHIIGKYKENYDLTSYYTHFIHNASDKLKTDLIDILVKKPPHISVGVGSLNSKTNDN